MMDLLFLALGASAVLLLLLSNAQLGRSRQNLLERLKFAAALLDQSKVILTDMQATNVTLHARCHAAEQNCTDLTTANAELVRDYLRVRAQLDLLETSNEQTHQG